MKINTLFSIFTPKDVKFIPALKEMTSILVESAAILNKIFTLSDKEEQKMLCLLIKEEEQKGDKVSSRISKKLNETFITPFDREDIHSLSETMDDAIDAINRTAQKLMLYAPETLPEHLFLLSEMVKKQAEEIQIAVGKLSKIGKTEKEIRRHCKEVKRLEESADLIYEEAIMALFNNGVKAVELIKLKEIIQETEKSADKIDSVAKVIKTILVKYA